MLEILNGLLEVLIRVPAAYERDRRFVGCLMLALVLSSFAICAFLGWLFFGAE